MKISLFCLIFFSVVCKESFTLKLGFTVHVTITGLHSNKGEVILLLYNSEDGFPKDHAKAYRTAASIISNSICTIDLQNVPEGTYAIAFFHDENNNGILESNFLGLPAEGVGTSDNGTAFIGPPT